VREGGEEGGGRMGRLYLERFDDRVEAGGGGDKENGENRGRSRSRDKHGREEGRKRNPNSYSIMPCDVKTSFKTDL
jgi:hypothetical protein